MKNKYYEVATLTLADEPLKVKFEKLADARRYVKSNPKESTITSVTVIMKDISITPRQGKEATTESEIEVEPEALVN